MKVAIVWNHASRLLDCSFRFEQYVAGVKELGHEAAVVCVRPYGEGFKGPVISAETSEDLRDEAFWRKIGADAAIMVTWHRMSAELEALRRAGIRVAALSDTDGRVGFRPFGGYSLMLTLAPHRGGFARARALFGWILERAKASVRGSWEEREAVLSTSLSKLVAIGHSEGVRNFHRFLSFHGAGTLAEGVVEIPFTIGESFFQCSVPEAKSNRITAVGRWDSWQKNARLLATALGLLVRERPDTEIHILGRGAESQFASLPALCSGLVIRGEVGQADVAECLATSRSIVFSSRWEGCPHAALEALALGATVIGTPLPSLRSWAEDGRFGTVASRSRPADLANAMLKEMTAWDSNQRDPIAISQHWRNRLAPRAVCGALLADDRADGPAD